MTIRRVCFGFLPVLLGVLAVPTMAREPFAASQTAVTLDQQLRGQPAWEEARFLAVQDRSRYKTLESFARESMTAMYGRESLPGLSPLASMFEWLFNHEAYADAPVVRIRDMGLRVHFTTEMSEVDRLRVRQDGYMTPREFNAPVVQKRIEELEPLNTMQTAIGRVRDAQATLEFLPRMLCLVPTPQGDAKSQWYPPQQLLTNVALAFPESGVSAETISRKLGKAVPGISGDQAWQVSQPWTQLEAAWKAGDAAGVAQALGKLEEILPALAAPGVYPPEAQRRAEALYYKYFVSASIFSPASLGWSLYFLGALFGVWALVTGWRTPWLITVVLLIVAMTWHAFGLGLRWYILGRIPVANMFEALTASAWVGIALALVAEIWTKMRVFGLAACKTGFLALILAGYVVPGGGTITSIMGILDDIMLRIHTVLIISSYALIFLASVIAVVYLIGYYQHQLAGSVTARLPVGLTGASFAPAGVMQTRPVLAGDMPGDERSGILPLWLNQMDWCQLIILNMVFILLFVGIILGAVWADYSWGRPWGWDPKEVFAMNTWIIYAILIHARFLVKRKGLWTSWLSVAGCAMMAFNWAIVNFFIVGLHSYA